MTPDTISPISQFGPIAKEHPEEPVWLRKDCIRELAHTLRHQELPTNTTIVRSSTRSSAIRGGKNNPRRQADLDDCPP